MLFAHNITFPTLNEILDLVGFSFHVLNKLSKIKLWLKNVKLSTGAEQDHMMIRTWEIGNHQW